MTSTPRVTDEEIAGLRRWHSRCCYSYTEHVCRCQACQAEWPCPTIRLADVLARMRPVMDAAERLEAAGMDYSRQLSSSTTDSILDPEVIKAFARYEKACHLVVDAVLDFKGAPAAPRPEDSR